MVNLQKYNIFGKNPNDYSHSPDYPGLTVSLTLVDREFDLG